MNPRIVYLGPGPYEFEDWEKLGGRDEELKELYHAVQENVFTLVYGQSGVGKTSLIRAGLSPELGDNFFLPITIRLNYSETHISSNRVLDWIHKKINQSISEYETTFERIGKQHTLWSYFQSIKLSGGLRPVLIIDQFEELLTMINKSSFVDIPEFLQQLSSLSRNVPDKPLQTKDYTNVNYRLLVSMRADYLFRLPLVKRYLPIHTQNQFLITDITGEQAIQAIQRPAMSIGQQVDKDVAIEIVERVTHAMANDESSAQFDVSIETDWRKKTVSPHLLSFYCFKLNQECEPKDFSLELLEQFNLNSIVKAHYKDVVASSADIQNAIENKLISERGVRLMYPAGDDLFDDYANRKLNLIEQRIVQEVSDQGRTYVELVHDMLAEKAFEQKVIRQKEEEKQKREDEIRLENLKKELTLSLKLNEALKMAENEKGQKILEQEKTIRAEKRRNQFAYGLILLAFSATAIVSYGLYRIVNLNESRILTSQAFGNMNENPMLALNLIGRAKELVDDESNNKSQLAIYDQNRFHKTLDTLNGIIYSTHIKKNDRLISTSDSRAITILDTSGNQIWQGSIKHPIMAATLPSNRKLWALGGNKGQVTLLDLSTREEIDTFTIPNSKITDLAFSPNGQFLYGTDAKHPPAFFLNLSTRITKRFDTLNGHTGNLFGIEYDSVTNRVYTAGHDGKVKAWTSDGTFIKDVFHHQKALIYDLKLSKDGRTLLIPATDGAVYRVNPLDSNDRKSRLFLKEENLFSANFSTNEKYILSGNGDGVARLWHSSGDLVQEYIGQPNSIVWEVLMTSDHKYVITAGQDGAVKKWSTSGLILERYGQKEGLYSASFSYIKGNGLSEFKVPNETQEFQTLNGKIESLKVRFTSAYQSFQNNKFLVVIDNEGIQDSSTLYTYHKASDEWMETGPIQHTRYDKAYALHPQKPQLAFIQKNGLGRVVNLLDASKSYSFKSDTLLTHLCIAYTPDAKYLMYGSTGTVVVYKNQNGKPQFSRFLKGHHHENKYINCFAFHKGKQLMATGSDDGQVVLRNLGGSFEHVKTLSPPTRARWVSSVAISPEGTHVLVGYESGKVYLFRIEDGFVVQEFKVLNQETASVMNVGFHPTQKQVVVQYNSGYTRIWEIRESLESFLKRGDYDNLTEAEKKKYGL